jgi:formylglycine-generating enzyme required for sulfatase activity/actin-like ATPase involved in cell morphogenesis
VIEEKYRIMAIDFGTTNSAMAWWNPDINRAQVIPNADGEYRTPSVVFYSPQGVVVGRAAEKELVNAQLNINASKQKVISETIFRSIKRNIDNGVIHNLPDGTEVKPVDIATEIFRKLKMDAEKQLFRKSVKQVVITCPASFGPMQRDAIKKAAFLSGFETIKLLEEPVAAVTGYMAQSGSEPGGFLVFDLGGGTFDLAFICRNDSHGYHSPLPPSGNPRCGGDDFDRAIYDFWKKSLFSSGYDDNGKPLQSTLLKCRKCKEDLSSHSKTSTAFILSGTLHHLVLERTELEELIASYVNGIMQLVQKMIHHVQSQGFSLDHIVMIGGSARIPLIERAFRQLCTEHGPGKPLFVDNVVALGAAMAGVCTKATTHVEINPMSKIINSLDIRLVYIPPGSFIMGSPPDELNRKDDEIQHEVNLTEGFYMGETAVTVGQFRSFISATGYKTKAETDGGAEIWTGSIWKKMIGYYWDHPGFEQTENHPVTCISFLDAQEFIKWLNLKEDRGYRLPTEAEWEYAARAGTTTSFSFGHYLSTDQANYNCIIPFTTYTVGIYRKKTTPVKKFAPNGWGLFDMHGNVFEWCLDKYDRYPIESVSDPKGPFSGTFQVMRGGCWSFGDRACRSAGRECGFVDDRYNFNGFRLVASLMR